MSRLQDALHEFLDRTANLRRLQKIGDEMNTDKFDKWITGVRGSMGLQTEAVQRETENDLARQKRTKLDEPKDYEKRMKAEAAKSAKLRALRLAKEAEEARVRDAEPKPRSRAVKTAK